MRHRITTPALDARVMSLEAEHVIDGAAQAMREDRERFGLAVFDREFHVSVVSAVSADESERT
jgi:hypothetical protein